MRNSILFAALLLIGTPALAQVDVCSAARPDPYFYATTYYDDVTLNYYTSVYSSLFFSGGSVPSVNVANYTIVVRQSVATQSGKSPACMGSAIRLGKLPPGIYDLVWQMSSAPQDATISTFRASIEVPPTTTIGPCEGGPVDPFYSVTLNPVTLHEESLYSRYETESVSIVGHQITIAERQFIGGAGPLSSSLLYEPCQQWSTRLGSLAPGRYDVTLKYYPHVGPVPPASSMAATATPETPIFTTSYSFVVPVIRPRAVRH